MIDFINFKYVEKIVNSVNRLIFDADDTLWDNNIYYINAEQAFYNLCANAGLDKNFVNEEFDRLELKVVREMGYGSKNYIFILNSMFQNYQQLSSNVEYVRKFEQIVSEFQNHVNIRTLFSAQV